jgi:hypothetical protein
LRDLKGKKYGTVFEVNNGVFREGGENLKRFYDLMFDEEEIDMDEVDATKRVYQSMT